MNYLSDEQVNMFQSDFKIVADYFVQMRKNKNYIPSRQTMKHVHEILQMMAVFTQDNRFEECQNLFVKGENTNMSDYLERIIKEGEARGKLDFAYKLIRKGRLTVEEAAENIGISINELLAQFKQYNLVL